MIILLFDLALRFPTFSHSGSKSRSNPELPLEPDDDDLTSSSFLVGAGYMTLSEYSTRLLFSLFPAHSNSWWLPTQLVLVLCSITFVTETSLT